MEFACRPFWWKLRKSPPGGFEKRRRSHAKVSALAVDSLCTCFDFRLQLLWDSLKYKLRMHERFKLLSRLASLKISVCRVGLCVRGRSENTTSPLLKFLEKFTIACDSDSSHNCPLRPRGPGTMLLCAICGMRVSFAFSVIWIFKILKGQTGGSNRKTDFTRSFSPKTAFARTENLRFEFERCSICGILGTEKF